VTAAVGAYGGAVLAKVRDDAADATVGVGRRLLQRVFGQRAEDEPLPEPLAALAADPGDADALGMVRYTMRQALEADAAMLEEVKSMLTSAHGVIVEQNIRAGRDAYVAGRDMTINRLPGPWVRGRSSVLTLNGDLSRPNWQQRSCENRHCMAIRNPARCVYICRPPHGVG
jgi:hypothetical protein